MLSAEESNGATTAWMSRFIALGLVWGSSFLLVKLIIDEFTPVGIAFWRSTAGAIVLLAICRFRREKLPTNRRHLVHLLVISILFGIAPTLLVTLGAEGITSSVGGVLSATIPTATALATFTFFPSQRATANQLVGIVLGFLGIFLISEVFLGVGENELSSVALVLLATFCYGIGLPYSKRFVVPLGYSGMALAAAQVTIAAVALLPIALFAGSTRGTPSLDAVVFLTILGVFGSGFAFVWNLQVLESAGSTIASSVTYITPLVAALLGFIVLGERLDLLQILGVIIVVVSSAVVHERIRLVPSKT